MSNCRSLGLEEGSNRCPEASSSERIEPEEQICRHSTFPPRDLQHQSQSTKSLASLAPAMFEAMASVPQGSSESNTSDDELSAQKSSLNVLGGRTESPTDAERDTFTQDYSINSNDIFDKLKASFKSLKLLNTQYENVMNNCLVNVDKFRDENVTLLGDLRTLKELTTRMKMEQQACDVGSAISSMELASQPPIPFSSIAEPSVPTISYSEVTSSGLGSESKLPPSKTGSTTHDKTKDQRSSVQDKSVAIVQTTSSSTKVIGDESAQVAEKDDEWIIYSAKRKIQQREPPVFQGISAPRSSTPLQMQKPQEPTSSIVTPTATDVSTPKLATPSAKQKPRQKKKTPKKAVKTPVKEELDDDFWYSHVAADVPEIEFEEETECVLRYNKHQTSIRERLIRFGISSQDHMIASDSQLKLVQFHIAHYTESTDSEGAKRRQKAALEFLDAEIREYSQSKKYGHHEILKKFKALHKNCNGAIAMDISYFRQIPRLASERIQKIYFPMIFTSDQVLVNLNTQRLSTDPRNAKAEIVFEEERWSVENLQRLLHQYIATRRAARSATIYIPDRNRGFYQAKIDKIFIQNKDHAEQLLKPEFHEILLAIHSQLWSYHTVATLTTSPQTKGSLLRHRFIQHIKTCREVEVLYDSWCLDNNENDWKNEAGSMENILKLYLEDVFLHPIGESWGRFGRNQ